MFIDLSRPVNYAALDLDELAAAANAGYGPACYIGSILYQEGMFRNELDTRQATTWLRHGAEQDDPFCMARYGLYLFTGVAANGNPDREFGEALCINAFRRLEAEAKKGNVHARSLLGNMYTQGCGVPVDDPLGLEYFLAAAEKGEVTAQCSAGICYQTGTGTPKNLPKAVEWLQHAAIQGSGSAQLNLGIIYKDGGKDLDANTKKAIKWFKQAARQGNFKAMSALCHIYRSQNSRSADVNELIEWLKPVAMEGETEAEIILGNFCKDPINGQKPSYAGAAFWYGRLADKGDTVAMENLIELYGNKRYGIRDKSLERKYKDMLAAATQPVFLPPAVLEHTPAEKLEIVLGTNLPGSTSVVPPVKEALDRTIQAALSTKSVPPSNGKAPLLPGLGGGAVRPTGIPGLQPRGNGLQ